MIVSGLRDDRQKRCEIVRCSLQRRAQLRWRADPPRRDTHNWSPTAFDVAKGVWPARPSRATVTGWAILERSVVEVPDVDVDQVSTVTKGLSATVGYSSVLAVPMIRDGAPFGATAVGRAEPGPFSDKQIDLLKTFANQAAIAIADPHLFEANKPASMSCRSLSNSRRPRRRFSRLSQSHRMTCNRCLLPSRQPRIPQSISPDL